MLQGKVEYIHGIPGIEQETKLYGYHSNRQIETDLYYHNLNCFRTSLFLGGAAKHSVKNSLIWCFPLKEVQIKTSFNAERERYATHTDYFPILRACLLLNRFDKALHLRVVGSYLFMTVFATDFGLMKFFRVFQSIAPKHFVHKRIPSFSDV